MYRWKRLPFGLSASSEIFWRLNRFVNYLPTEVSASRRPQTTQNQYVVSQDKNTEFNRTEEHEKASGEVKLLL